MITILHPSIIGELTDIPVGLLPIQTGSDSDLSLIIKAPKEMILTAKVRQGFRFYFVAQNKNQITIGVVTAFFDDPDQPLTIWSPLFADDMAQDLLRMLSQESFDVYFFDENNRELLGYRAQIKNRKEFSNKFADFRVAPFSMDLARKALDQMPRWFSLRTEADDRAAISVEFVEALFPDNILIFDNRPEVNSYRGFKSTSHTKLERNEAGALQELDIVMILQRIFPSKSIYLNPFRVDKHKEFLDILVVTGKNVFFIQAKDSPNTAATLNRSLERKKAVIMSHLIKAARQTKGAVAYFNSCNPLKIFVNDKIEEVPLSGLCVRCLILVPELFNDEFSSYSDVVLKLVAETNVPCLALSYFELHQYTLSQKRRG